MLLSNFINVIYRYMTIKDIIRFHYHGRANLAKTVAASELYFSRQAEPGYFRFQTLQNLV